MSAHARTATCFPSLENVRSLAPRNLAKVLADLSRRRAQIASVDSDLDRHEDSVGTTTRVNVVIQADTPLSQLVGYSTQLRTITAGEGSFGAEFARYEPVPKEEAKEILSMWY